MRTEKTAYGTRTYICDQLLRTVKIGETWSLDYAARCLPYNPVDALVAFDGRRPDGCYCWRRESDGRVFIYTAEQCRRLIYRLSPGESSATA